MCNPFTCIYNVSKPISDLNKFEKRKKKYIYDVYIEEMKNQLNYLLARWRINGIIFPLLSLYNRRCYSEKSSTIVLPKSQSSGKKKFLKAQIDPKNKGESM